METEAKPNRGTGPKRTKAQRIRDVAEIAELWSEGWTQVEIVDHIAANRPYRLGRTTIIKDCRMAEEIWRQRSAESIEARIARELSKADHTEREAWKAWRESKREQTKTEVSQATGGTAAAARSRITKETRDGNPAFLMVALQCIDRRCRILGIDAPSKTEISGPAGQAIQVKDEGPIDRATLDALIVERAQKLSGNATQP